MAPSSRDRLNTIKNSNKRRRELAGLRNTAANANNKAKRELAFSRPAPMKSPEKARPSLFEKLSYSPLFDTRLLRGMTEQSTQARNRANIIRQAADNPNISRSEKRNLQLAASWESPEVKGFIEEYGGSGVIGSVARRGISRVSASYREEVEDIAQNLAEEASRLAPFTETSARKVAEQVAEKGRATVNPDIISQIRGETFGWRNQVGGGQARYVIGGEDVEDIASILKDPEKYAETLLGRLGTSLKARDLPFGINPYDVLNTLGLGKGAPMVGGRRGPSKIDEIQILGASRSNIASGGTQMFKQGAKTGEDIAKTIYPNFRGKFNPVPLTPESAGRQIELLQESRGGIPALRTGKVIDLSGEKIDALSKRLYNAHDHAAAKAREASTQAIEQRIADVLNIKLSDDFLSARQTRLDMVNNPNENDVLIDFLANSGKGGVGLSDLKPFLQKQLDSPDITPYQRQAYRQMLGDVIGGRYKEIEKRYRAITNQVEDPLKDVINPKFRKEFGDAVDEFRRKLRDSKENYDDAQFAADMEALGNAVEAVARSTKGRISFSAVKKASGLFD